MKGKYCTSFHHKLICGINSARSGNKIGIIFLMKAVLNKSQVYIAPFEDIHMLMRIYTHKQQMLMLRTDANLPRTFADKLSQIAAVTHQIARYLCLVTMKSMLFARLVLLPTDNCVHPGKIRVGKIQKISLNSVNKSLFPPRDCSSDYRIYAVCFLVVCWE